MAPQRSTRFHHRSLEVWIAHVLRVGVVLASAVILLGLALALLGNHPTGVQEAVNGRANLRAPDPASLRQDLARGDPVAVVQLGLLLLILTPAVRVALTVVLFALQRDWAFVVIAATVLLLLALGLAGLVPL